MILRIWRLVTLLLTALVMGTSFCHVLEMPVKMQADGQLGTTLQHTLYRYFAILGGTVEVGAILAAALLSYRVRGRSRAFRLSVVGAVGLAASFAVWLGFVNPVNRQTAAWTVDSIPGNWAAWRAQWEYGHAVRFALHLIAFSALTLSVLVETSGFHAPGKERGSQRARPPSFELERPVDKWSGGWPHRLYAVAFRAPWSEGRQQTRVRGRRVSR
jgi:hypothetical protein